MLYYKFGQRVEKLDKDGAYFMPDDVYYATRLLSSEMFSNEVNIINMLKRNFDGIAFDKNFIDIGANVGTYTMVLGEIFNHTYAFEPNKETYNMMCGNIALHNLSFKTDLYRIGLSDKADTLEYHYVDFVGGGNMFVKPEDNTDLSNTLIHQYDSYQDDATRAESMPVATLDSFNIQNVGLMKIDVEGFELNVLKGGIKTLENSNFPPIVIESWNVEAGDSKEVEMAKIELRNNLFSFLRNFGYKIDNLENDVFYCER